MSARGRRLKVIPKAEETPAPALGDASDDLKAVSLLLRTFVLGEGRMSTSDVAQDHALMILADVLDQIAEHGRVL